MSMPLIAWPEPATVGPAPATQSAPAALDQRILVVVRWPVGGIRTHLQYTYPFLGECGWRFTFVGPDDSLDGLARTLRGLDGCVRRLDAGLREGHDHGRKAAVEPLQRDFRPVGKPHGILVGPAFEAGHHDFFDSPDAAGLANGLANAFQQQVGLRRDTHGQVTARPGREALGATWETLEGELLSFFSRSG